MNKLIKNINMGYYILYLYEEISKDYNCPWKKYLSNGNYSITVKRPGKDEKVCAIFSSLEEAEEFLREIENRQLRLYSQLREFLEELSF